MPFDFENPPINEVVIATYFDPPLVGLRSEYIGLFWQEIREQFPTAEQQLPTGGTQGPMVGPLDVGLGETFPLPRYWFVSADEITLLQIQKNAFMLNWRNREQPYPGFAENLKPAFDKYYQAFSDFVRAEMITPDLQIGVCELTYINAVPQSEFWSGVLETSRIIPSFAVPDPKLPQFEQTGFQCAYGYSVAPDIRLQVNIRNGFLTDQPEIPVLVFELKSTGRLDPSSKSRADGWFERAHETITDCFLGLTSRKAQTRLWKLQEANDDC